MRSLVLSSVVVVSLLALVACGQSPGCRAVTGAAMGAAGGAAIGAFAGVPLLGAAAGGIAGAVTGGVTSPNQVSAGSSPFCS
jgi:osmotically inducible lipoprotein OsmB